MNIECMKSILLTLFLMCMKGTVISQTENQLPARLLQIDFGINKHGTGDMPGCGLNVDYKKYLRKRIFLSFGLGMTTNNGTSKIFYTDDAGNLTDASYRYGAGGAQISGEFGISMIRDVRNDFGLQAGIIGRYQSSSYYDEITVLYPVVTGLPIPVTAVVHKSPQETISIGGIGQVYYNYFINAKVFVGFRSSLQMDSNGDVLTQFMISSGFKL